MRKEKSECPGKRITPVKKDSKKSRGPAIG